MNGGSRTEFLQRPSNPKGLLVNPLPSFNFVGFEKDCFHVFYHDIHSAELLLLQVVGN